MTDKLHCPFCRAELKLWSEDIDGREFLYCENLKCPMSPQIELPISIWQALIDGKKAQDALNYVLLNLDAYMNMYLKTRRNPSEFTAANEHINNVKRKITSITKQEK